LKNICVRGVGGYCSFRLYPERFLNVVVWHKSSWDRCRRHSLFLQTQAVEYFSYVWAWSLSVYLSSEWSSINLSDEVELGTVLYGM